MRIERVLIRKLRALRERDDVFLGADGQCWSSLCMRGLNGSGKTTYLEALAQLWQWFRRCTAERAYARPAGTPLLAEAELVAALFVDLPFPKKRMWLAYGTSDAVRSIASGPENPYSFRSNQILWDEEVLAKWDVQMTMAQSGVGTDSEIPNIVWIEAESKYVRTLRKNELTNPRPAPAFLPVARYLPEAKGPSNLEALMRTLFLARRERWDQLARWIRELRPDLELVDRFEEETQRPLFRLKTGEYLSVERLSAGERSLLINLCMILRWLGPGGIVLLDEPELHQHLSLMRGSLAVIDSLVSEEFGGQLLVASHAPEVWEHFRSTNALLELGEP